MLAMFGMAYWAIYWLRPDGPLSLPEIAGILCVILFDGLRAPAMSTPAPHRRAAGRARRLA